MADLNELRMAAMVECFHNQLRMGFVTALSNSMAVIARTGRECEEIRQRAERAQEEVDFLCRQADRA
jgi:hypothetical protein